jgi:flagellum-specific peptidoglycan hydrolase FlgJ
LTREEFIKKHALAATVASFGNSIFPETLLVQSIIESANSAGVPGESSLAKKYNNYFGIKAAGGWKGKSVSLRTGEYFGGVKTTITDAFRVYPSYYASIRDVVKFYQTYSRYKFVLQAKDVEAQLRAIGLSGYATSPTYGSALLSIYRANKTTIDKQVKLSKVKLFGFAGLVAAGSYYVFKNPRLIPKTFPID